MDLDGWRRTIEDVPRGEMGEVKFSIRGPGNGGTA